MNNAQRDDLLISLAKGLNNMQESLNDFRKEFNVKIDSVDQRLTNEIRIQSSKIDALAKDQNEFKEETHNNFKEVREDLDNFKEETRNNFKEVREDLNSFRKEHKDFKKETDESFKELIGISGNVFDNVYSEIKNHLNQHDIEIAELKVKLA